MPSFRMRKSRFRGADNPRLRGDDGAAPAATAAVPGISSIVIAEPPRTVGHMSDAPRVTVVAPTSPRSSEPVTIRVDTTPVVAPDASPQTPKVGIVVKR